MKDRSDPMPAVKVVIVMKPVDGGRACIGLIDCPYCGETHYTTNIKTGERDVFCGQGAQKPDGYSFLCVTHIM